MTHTEREIYDEAVHQRGIETQSWMLIEEMAELTKALCKKRRNLARIETLIEEIADVKLMLAQIERIWECEPQVEHMRQAKLMRLEKILWPKGER